jgi:hypothetical protein
MMRETIIINHPFTIPTLSSLICVGGLLRPSSFVLAAVAPAVRDRLSWARHRAIRERTAPRAHPRCGLGRGLIVGKSVLFGRCAVCLSISVPRPASWSPTVDARPGSGKNTHCATEAVLCVLPGEVAHNIQEPLGFGYAAGQHPAVTVDIAPM